MQWLVTNEAPLILKFFRIRSRFAEVDVILHMVQEKVDIEVFAPKRKAKNLGR